MNLHSANEGDKCAAQARVGAAATAGSISLGRSGRLMGRRRLGRVLLVGRGFGRVSGNSLGRGSVGFMRAGGRGRAALGPGLATGAVGRTAPESSLAHDVVVLLREVGIDGDVVACSDVVVVVVAASDVAVVGEGGRGGEGQSEGNEALVNGWHRVGYF